MPRSPRTSPRASPRRPKRAPRRLRFSVVDLPAEMHPMGMNPAFPSVSANWDPDAPVYLSVEDRYVILAQTAGKRARYLLKGSEYGSGTAPSVHLRLGDKALELHVKALQGMDTTDLEVRIVDKRGVPGVVVPFRLQRSRLGTMQVLRLTAGPAT